MFDSKQNSQDENRNLKKTLSASVTVEAAFVVPIVIWVLILIIYSALYLHDTTVSRAELTELLSEAAAFSAWDVYPGTTNVLYENKLKGDLFSAVLGDDSDEREAYLSAYAAEHLGQGLIVSGISEIRVRLSDSRITVSCLISGSKNGFLSAFLPKLLFQKKMSASCEREDNTGQNRLVTAVLRTGRKVKGLRALADSLNQILDKVGK